MSSDASNLSVLACVDEDYYVRTYPDVASSEYPPAKHYLLQGWRENRAPNPWFDPAWYLENNQDIASQDLNPLVHYLGWGWREGRQPHPSPRVQEAVREVARQQPTLCPLLVLVARHAN